MDAKLINDALREPAAPVVIQIVRGISRFDIGLLLVGTALCCFGVGAYVGAQWEQAGTEELEKENVRLIDQVRELTAQIEKDNYLATKSDVG
jgi:hypothetical protein